MKKGYKALIAEAEAEIKTLSVDEARALLGQPDVYFIDIREKGELLREGRMPGAHHAPRGMLEFWADPESPYYRDIFGQKGTFVFFCAGGWRSALATKVMQEMGLEDVCHIAGGFSAWKQAGGWVELADE